MFKTDDHHPIFPSSLLDHDPSDHLLNPTDSCDPNNTNQPNTESSIFHNPYSIISPFHYFYNIYALLSWIGKSFQPGKSNMAFWAEDRMERTLAQNFNLQELMALKQTYRDLHRTCFVSGFISLFYFNRKAQKYGIVGTRHRIRWSLSSFFIGYLAPFPWFYMFSLSDKWKIYCSTYAILVRYHHEEEESLS